MHGVWGYYFNYFREYIAGLRGLLLSCIALVSFATNSTLSYLELGINTYTITINILSRESRFRNVILAPSGLLQRQKSVPVYCFLAASVRISLLTDWSSILGIWQTCAVIA